MNNIKNKDTNEIVCPYCGYEHAESWSKDLDVFYCSNCGKPFSVNRTVCVSYTSEAFDVKDTPLKCEGCENENVYPVLGHEDHYCKFTGDITSKERSIGRLRFCPYSSLIQIQREEHGIEPLLKKN